jgi:hypothetical protein
MLAFSGDSPDVRVDAVRQNEIDNAELAAEKTAGLARRSVSCWRRLPHLPARISAIVRRATRS